MARTFDPDATRAAFAEPSALSALKHWLQRFREPPVTPALDDQLQAVHATLEDLRQELRDALAKADRRYDVIERLEAENQALKRRDDERKQEPVVKGLIALFDDLRSVTLHARAEADAVGGDGSEGVQRLVAFQRHALDLLRRAGAEPFEPGLGERFDPSRQEAWATVPTTSEAQDMSVSEVVRFGFDFAGRVLRPAAVKVHRFQPLPTEEPDK